MNKKYMFGFLAFAMVALVSAALVDYLSTPIQKDFEVLSPLQQTLTDEFSSMYGGESKTFYIETKNLADVPITGMVKNIVTNRGGVTCEDFESVLVSTSTNGEGYGPEYDLTINLCSQVNDYTIQFDYGPQPNTWDAYQIDTSKIIVTLKQNALGTYNFNSQIFVPTA